MPGHLVKYCRGMCLWGGFSKRFPFELMDWVKQASLPSCAWTLAFCLWLSKRLPFELMDWLSDLQTLTCKQKIIGFLNLCNYVRYIDIHICILLVLFLWRTLTNRIGALHTSLASGLSIGAREGPISPLLLPKSCHIGIVLLKFSGLPWLLKSLSASPSIPRWLVKLLP